MTGTAAQLTRYLAEQDPAKKWDLEPHREKRSLTQNAYYWVLASKVAERLKISTARLHNTLLRDAGYVSMVGDQMVTAYLPDTDEAESWALESTTVHMMPTSNTKSNGKERRRMYLMLQGSSEFNTAQMTRLLDLMIQEAKAQGIETMTENELAHMRELERQHEQKKQGL